MSWHWQPLFSQCKCMTVLFHLSLSRLYGCWQVVYSLQHFFEFTLRISRVYLSDIIGKRADLRVSDRVFGHALRIKNKDRSKSTGSFISQIRELEGVRELVTSTTISAIADFPFFFLFLIILRLLVENCFG